MKPFFIVGVQRSGTTLLRSVLNAHPDIFVAYECAMYRLLGPRHAPFITDKVSFLDDLFSVPRFNYWGVSREQCEEIVSDSFSGTIMSIARLAARREYELFGFKNPNGLFHLDYTLWQFPNAKILHIMRDPRAVLASEKKKILTQNAEYIDYFSIWQVARRTRLSQEICAKWSGRNNYLAIKYADLIANFDDTVSDILGFLGVSRHDLSNYKGDIPDAEMSYHAKAMQAPDLSRVNAFENELTSFEISAIEGLCRPYLESKPLFSPTLGYISALGVIARKGWSRISPINEIPSREHADKS